jgi:hypothetical protein
VVPYARCWNVQVQGGAHRQWPARKPVDDEVYGGRNIGTSRNTAIQSSTKCGAHTAHLFARGSATNIRSITRCGVVVFLPMDVLTNIARLHSGQQMQRAAKGSFLKQLFMFGSRLLQSLYRIGVR